MAAGEVVKDIIRTYELPPKLEDRLLSIATRRVQQLGLESFDGIYRYIDWLVNRFTKPLWREPLSLDATLAPDSERTLHDVIGKEDKGLTDLFGSQEAESAPNGLIIADILKILKGTIDDSLLDMVSRLQYLRGNSIGPIDLSTEEVAMNATKIQARLEELAQRYQRDGKLVLPPRPIKSVKFNPDLRIEFSARRYNGNPLAFFLANLEAYNGMTRKQLMQFDAGIYGALLDHNQMGIAIPTSLWYLPREEIAKIVAALSVSDGNVSEGVRQTGHSPQIVRKYGVQAGLIIGQRDTPFIRELHSLPKEERVRIADTLSANKGNIARTVEQSGHVHDTVRKYGLEYGVITLDPSKKSNQKYSQEDLNTLYSEFSKGTPLSELEVKLQRGAVGIARKIRALSKQDPAKWNHERALDYYRQWKSIEYHQKGTKEKRKEEWHKWYANAAESELAEYNQRRMEWHQQRKGRWAEFADYFGRLLEGHERGYKKEVALALGISQHKLSEFLAGSVKPKYEFLLRASTLFNVPYDVLHDLVKPKSSDTYAAAPKSP